MSTIDARFEVQGPVLADFMKSDAYVQVIRGPLGSSKTTTVVAKILHLFQLQRPNADGKRQTRVIVIRATYPELESILIPDLKRIIPPSIVKFKNSYPFVAKFDYDLPDGTKVDAEMLLLAVESPDDIRKLRGLQGTFTWANELRFMMDPVIFGEALSRCNRYPAPGWSPFVGGIADSNAWDEDHWLEERALGLSENERTAEQQGAWRFFIQPPGVIETDEFDLEGIRSATGGYWKVNPEAENLSKLTPDYYANQIATNRDDWIRVNLANQLGFTLAGKLVHPLYSAETHEASENYKPDPSLPIFIGMDYGMQAAACYLQKDLRGTWNAFYEVVCEEGGVPTLAQGVKYLNPIIAAEMGVPEQAVRLIYVGDPSGDSRHETDENTAFKILLGEGIVAQPARSNDVALRREALDRPLKRQNGFRVSPRCKVLRKALASGFILKRKRVSGMELYQDKPDKNKYSHIVEACEYGLMNAGEHAVINSPFAESPAGRARNRPIVTQKNWNAFEV